MPKLPVAASFEPVGALDGGADGLAVIARLLAVLPDELAPRGVALLEIGSDQAERLTDMAGAAVARLASERPQRPDWPAARGRNKAHAGVSATVVGAADPSALDRAQAELEAGQIVGIPTETVYGLAVLPIVAALARLIEAKQRSADKGIACSSTHLSRSGSSQRVTPVAGTAGRAFLAGRSDAGPATAAGRAAARAAGRRPADPRRPPARPRRPAGAGAPPRPARRQLGQHLRRARRHHRGRR